MAAKSGSRIEANGVRRIHDRECTKPTAQRGYAAQAWMALNAGSPRAGAVERERCAMQKALGALHHRHRTRDRSGHAGRRSEDENILERLGAGESIEQAPA